MLCLGANKFVLLGPDHGRSNRSIDYFIVPRYRGQAVYTSPAFTELVGRFASTEFRCYKAKT